MFVDSLLLLLLLVVVVVFVALRLLLLVLLSDVAEVAVELRRSTTMRRLETSLASEYMLFSLRNLCIWMRLSSNESSTRRSLVAVAELKIFSTSASLLAIDAFFAAPVVVVVLSGSRCCCFAARDDDVDDERFSSPSTTTKWLFSTTRCSLLLLLLPVFAVAVVLLLVVVVAASLDMIFLATLPSLTLNTDSIE